MDMAGGDADFRAEAELSPVAELGGGVPEGDRGINAGEEAVGGAGVFGDDAIGVFAAVGGDVGEC